MNKFFFVLFLLIFSCKENDSQNTEPKLLFKSGFENDVSIIPNPDINNSDFDVITGKDNETGFSWPISILGAGDQGGLHYIDDDNRQAVYSELQTVIGHNGNETKALYSQENYANNATSIRNYGFNQW